MKPSSYFAYADRRPLIVSIVVDVRFSVGVGGVCGEIVERCSVEIVFGVAESRDMKRKRTHRRCPALSVVVVVLVGRKSLEWRIYQSAYGNAK